MKIIARTDCPHCKGLGYVLCGDENTGQMHPCSPCAARTALAWLLTRIGSWTHARWDQHVRHEFGDEIADALVHSLRDVPLEQLGKMRLSEWNAGGPSSA